MLEYISYGLFIITVGLAAFGIMLSTSLRKKYPGGKLSALIYYQVFVFAFGFYGMWGQAAFNIYIDELLSDEIRERISTIATLQGFPFMMLAWYMLIRFTRDITSRKTGTLFNTLYIIFSIIVFGSLIYLITRPDAEPGIYYVLYYSVTCSLLQIYAAMVLLFYRPDSKRIDRKKLSYISGFIILFTVCQIAILHFTDVSDYSALGFILSFFVLHSGVCVIARYSGLLKPLAMKNEFNGSFDSFCHSHEISPRESDIIKEICKGLTNKEISEALFISLQTVKDHTHRIYIKTGARNRVDLITRLKEVI